MEDGAPRRPNRFEIDLGAIAHNVAEVRRVVGRSTQIIAALKANAYGFGLGEVAEAVVSSGGTAIAVADLADAARLRERGIEVPILLYAGNLADAATVAAVESNRVMPTILDPSSAEVYSSLTKQPIRVFVKIDVGLERLGVAPEQAASLVKHIRALPNLEVHGLYTHVDVPGKGDVDAYITWQLQRYFRVCEELQADGIEIPVKMVSSSAVLRYTPDMRLDAVDPGHILFGLTPPGPANVDMDIRPAFRALKSRLIHTKRVDRHEFRDLAPVAIRDDMRIGIIPIGLRDGMASLNCGDVVVRGRRVAILGALSLEHTRIDLTDVPEARVGDEVVVIGQQGTAVIRPEEVIEHQGFAVKAELAMAVRESVLRIFL